MESSMDPSATRRAADARSSPQPASRLSQDARDTARSILGEQQQAAARSLGSMAGALRRAAGEEADGDGPSRLAESAADGLQRLSEALRSRDLDTLLRDTEDFARRQPAAFIGAAALAGFLAVRFLKSTHRSDDRR